MRVDRQAAFSEGLRQDALARALEANEPVAYFGINPVGADAAEEAGEVCLGARPSFSGMVRATLHGCNNHARVMDNK